MQRSTSPSALDDDVLAGLAGRFALARGAALRRVIRDAGAAEDERELLARAPDDSAMLERYLFETGYALGKSFTRFYGQSWALQDLPRVLPALGSPCADGVFSLEGDAVLLLRAGCADAGRGCAYWREALAGLIRGVNGELRMSRQSSRGSGGDRCVDEFCAGVQRADSFGPIPPDLEAACQSIERQVRAFDSGATVSFLGVNENVLYYQLAGGSGNLSLQGLVERGVHRRHPDLGLREVSWRQVVA